MSGFREFAKEVLQLLNSKGYLKENNEIKIPDGENISFLVRAHGSAWNALIEEISNSKRIRYTQELAPWLKKKFSFPINLTETKDVEFDEPKYLSYFLTFLMVNELTEVFRFLVEEAEENEAENEQESSN